MNCHERADTSQLELNAATRRLSEPVSIRQIILKGMSGMPYSIDSYFVHAPLKFVFQYLCTQVQAHLRVSQHHLMHASRHASLSALLARISTMGWDTMLDERAMDLKTPSG